jgi:hypothetical protein
MILLKFSFRFNGNHPESVNFLCEKIKRVMRRSPRLYLIEADQ